MSNVPHILVVDDDPEIRRLLGRYLDGQNMRTSLAGSRRECEQLLANSRIDLVVLDVMLPDGSGLDLCRELRGDRPHIPIILLTALKEEIDRIIGLELGADDYLGKPLNPRELLARIRAVLRRAEARTEDPVGLYYHFAGFTADPAGRRVTDAKGTEVALTGAEFELLVAFLDRPGRVLSRDLLLDMTQGRHAGPFDRSIDVLVSRLRRKFGDDGQFQLLKTVRNGGYQLTANVQRLRELV